MDWAWWQIVLFTLLLTHITIASITIFLHRCQAHRSLTLHPIASHFFRFWLWLTTGMVTKEWAAVHRKHHAKCETSEDPHSPQTRGILKVMFEGAELYKKEAKNPETLQKYGYGTPDDWMEHNIYNRFNILGVSLMLIVDVALFGVIGLTVWAVQMLWTPFWAAGVVNGLAHYWGYRNYNCADASTNIFPIGFLIGGEEMHNNHHTFATSAKFSNKWFEFDVGWAYIRILSWLRLATVKRVAPKPKIDFKKINCDFDTLQAVLLNRYEVMERYTNTFKRIYRLELARFKVVAKDKYHLMKGAKKWLSQHEQNLAHFQKDQLEQLCKSSKAFQSFYQLRTELYALWDRSNLSREQLLALLQSWCTRAEKSGVKALEDFAERLRRYS